MRHLLLPFLLLSCMPFAALADERSDADHQLLEPALSSYAKTAGGPFKAFRFSLQRSQEDEDLSYTVIVENGDAPPSVTIKTFSKASNRVTSQTTTPLTPGQVRNLLEGERMANFWQLPFKTKRQGFDGATWKMEGVSGSQSHTTERWSPMPPYYSFVEDKNTGKLIKDPNTSPEREFKSSDEVGLNIFSLMIIYLKPGYDGNIY